MSVLRFLKKYWAVPLVLGGGVLMFFLSRRYRERGTPIEQTVAELDAIQEATKVREMQVQLGTQAAKEHVEAEYRSLIDALEEDQKAKAERLKENPAALTKFLVRAGHA